jgi:hypothetical protein
MGILVTGKGKLIFPGADERELLFELKEMIASKNLSRGLFSSSHDQLPAHQVDAPGRQTGGYRPDQCGPDWIRHLRDFRFGKPEMGSASSSLVNSLALASSHPWGMFIVSCRIPGVTCAFS